MQECEQDAVFYPLFADIQQRVQALAASSPEEAAELPDSFAERAENYYQKRPQLISLLHDLHSRYVYLADRYSRSLNCRHRRDPSASAPSDDDDNDSEYPVHSVISSDAESTLSFHQLPNAPTSAAIAADSGNGGLEWLVAELVAAEVDRDLLLVELAESERLRTESARKAELQSSLLEVLESERMALLGENARLAYQAAAATEEASGLAAEAVYMRRKAAELARCMLKMREDHRVCLLGRKIEGLQAQIYGLERKNRECYEAMAKRQVEKVETRLEIERLQDENRRLKEAAAARKDRRRRLRSELVARWWAWVRNMEWAPPPCRPGMKAEKNGCVCVAFV
ncbi:hypothetical protein AXF42_Ash003677 [Apostasia shenzhenica]|uniref:NAB domain-containing protein n=1 Tax=Apostasia shenzhenica TaxID=1088818 RepID=A0A2I0AHM2_9ASPA|nr:hypothetical protein AXF42_Ash003677 [Apostasia shenzhenica]